MSHVLLCAELYLLQRRPVSLELPFVVADLRIVELASIGVLVRVLLLLQLRLESDQSATVLLEEDVDLFYSFELRQRLLLFNHRKDMSEVPPKCALLAVEEVSDRIECYLFESQC